MSTNSRPPFQVGSNGSSVGGELGDAGSERTRLRPASTSRDIVVPLLAASSRSRCMTESEMFSVAFIWKTISRLKCGAVRSTGVRPRRDGGDCTRALLATVHSVRAQEAIIRGSAQALGASRPPRPKCDRRVAEHRLHRGQRSHGRRPAARHLHVKHRGTDNSELSTRLIEDFGRTRPLLQANYQAI